MHTGGSLKEQHFLLMVHSFIYLTNYYPGLGGRLWLGMHGSHSAPECKRLRLFQSEILQRAFGHCLLCLCEEQDMGMEVLYPLVLFFKTQHDYILIYKQNIKHHSKLLTIKYSISFALHDKQLTSLAINEFLETSNKDKDIAIPREMKKKTTTKNTTEDMK